MKLDVARCYALAWKSFSKWWIPLCLISGAVVAFEILPRILIRADVNELMSTAREGIAAIARQDLSQLNDVAWRVRTQAILLMRKSSVVGLCAFPFLALFTVILLMYANKAVKSEREPGKPFRSLVYIAFVHVVLAMAKAIAFLFFFFPGAYLYIKLLFVSLIMLEEKRGAWTAIEISWRMTRGNFWRLFLLVLVNTGMQLLALPTIIGAVPVTGFANTARAAAFRMIWDAGHYAES